MSLLSALQLLSPYPPVPTDGFIDGFLLDSNKPIITVDWVR